MKNLLNLIFVLFSLSTFGQASGNVNYRPNSVGNYGYNPPNINNVNLKNLFLNDSTARLDAKVLINVKPAEQVAIFSINQTAENLEKCQEFMKQRVEGFISELKKNNIKEKDIFIDIISQVPTYEYDIDKKIFSKTANEVPTGFELKKNVHIHIPNDNKLLGEIMSMAAKYEIYDYVKSDYFISTQQRATLQDSLENVAINLIQKKKKKIELLDFDFKTNVAYKTLSESFDIIYPNNRYNSYRAYNTETTSKKYKNTNRINKTHTLYYDKIGYNLYDLVINPVVLEPSIQIAYVLELRYVFKQK